MSVDWEKVKSKLPMERTKEDKARRMDLFKRFDPNGNGYLSLAEVDKGVRDELGLDGIFDCKPVIIRAFNAAKRLNNKRGRSSRGPDYVEKCEFRMLLVYLRQYFEIWQMFDRVDRSDDQRIDINEFRNAMGLIERWGVKVENPDRTFRDIDTNDGGKILFDEFADWALDMSLDLQEDGSDDDDTAHMKAAKLAPLPEPEPEAPEENVETEAPQAPQQPVQEQPKEPAREEDAPAPTPTIPAPVEEVPAQQAAPTIPAVAPAVEPTPAPEETAPAAAAVAQPDVAAEYDGHYFSHADVEDIIKLQSLYRKQEGKRRAKARKEEIEAQRAAANAIPIEPITMPDLGDANDESIKNDSAVGPAGGHGRMANVDYSKIEVAAMSADTKGMQTMYTRMLKSKMWW